LAGFELVFAFIGFFAPHAMVVPPSLERWWRLPPSGAARGGDPHDSRGRAYPIRCPA